MESETRYLQGSLLWNVLLILANPNTFDLLVEISLPQFVVDQVTSVRKDSFSDLADRIVVRLVVVVLVCSSASVLDPKYMLRIKTLCCSNHGSACCGSRSGCSPRLCDHCRHTALSWSNNVLCSRSTAPLLWWLCGGLALKRSPNCSIDDSESVCSMLLANPFVVIHFLICRLL